MDIKKEGYYYTLTNAKGASVTLSEIGAGIVSIIVPDKDGKLADVVLGYEKPESYFGDGPFLGKCPGRFANRIALGKFTLNGKEYTLPINCGPNHLHGGPEGFSNKVWDSRTVGDAVEFMYFSEDGEQGYPGNLKVVAHYEWSEDNELKLSFTAECDADTFVNLTNHVYFNLNGEGNGNILGHMLKLNCSEYLPTDDTQIPLGDSEPVAGTPMDFTTPKAVGTDVDNFEYEQLKNGNGYDHNWVLSTDCDDTVPAAVIYCPETGIRLTEYTDEPGVQMYCGNFLDGTVTGKGGIVYQQRVGIVFESQHYPDSPNKPEWPSVVLRPGETYTSHCVFAFDTINE